MIYKLYTPKDFAEKPYATARSLISARKRAIDENMRTYITREGKDSFTLCGIVERNTEGILYNNLEKKIIQYLKKDGTAYPYR